MSLLAAPVYDERRARRNKGLLIATAALVVLLVVLTLLGYILGHGWLFSNLPAEHKVSQFYSALEARDYAKAYGIYTNDAAWEQHPDKHRGYPLDRFKEDWTSYSPVKGPVTSHHVDVSKTDNKTFIYVDRSDGTLEYPSPHIIEY